MERKAQQQTLSIRISDALREYLERAKNVMSSSRGDGVSTSDVAKMLLESAKDDRLDHRLEAHDFSGDRSHRCQTVILSFLELQYSRRSCSQPWLTALGSNLPDRQTRMRDMCKRDVGATATDNGS